MSTSTTSALPNINNLAPLYLRQGSKNSNKQNDEGELLLPFIGPIAIEISSSTNAVVQGRGLVATKDVEPGECLFVTRPAVSVPVEEVRRVWTNTSRKCGNHDSDGGEMGILEMTKKLEQVAETILVKRTKRILRSCRGDGGGTQRSVAMSILSQVGDRHHNNQLKQYQTNDINIVARSKVRGEGANNNSSSIMIEEISNDAILSIIHQNAFGPDFRHYHSIAVNWLSNNNNSYGRILSLYPLSAMINHSCRPNAVRVYSCNPCSSDSTTTLENSEVMAVHATQPIQKGEEILWSYVPTTRPYHDRQSRLKEAFGFDCACPRCVIEGALLNGTENDNDSDNKIIDLSLKMAPFEAWNTKSTNISELPSPSKFNDLMVKLEALLSDGRISGEQCRYLRAGMVTFYTNYLNVILSAAQSKNTVATVTTKEVLGLAAKVHLSLAAVDNGTTEHISILHLCYELANEQCRDADGNPNLPKFYSGQLQKAHLCRYGQLGGRVELLREVMVHSRNVLRRIQGFEQAKYCFI